MTYFNKLPSDLSGPDALETFTRKFGRPALRQVLDAVAADVSQVEVLVTDSTGVKDATATERWPFRLAQAKAARLGALGKRVEFYQLRGTAEPTVFEQVNKPHVLAAGASGKRGVQFTKTGSARARAIPSTDVQLKTTDDLEIIVLFDPAAAADQTAQGTIGCINTGTGNRMCMVSQLADQSIQLDWYEQGTETNQQARFTQAQLGCAPGTPVAVRFTVTGATGAVQAYSIPMASFFSTDPATLTAQSWGAAKAPTSTLNTIASTTINKPTAGNVEIGARGGITAPWFGTVYDFRIYDGINGPLLHSPSIDAYVQAGTNSNSRAVGSATLYIFNAAAAGKDLSWFDGTAAPADDQRRKRLIPPMADLVGLSTGHNEAARVGSVIKASLDNFVARTRTRAPMAQMYLIQQNPELTVASDGTTSFAVSALHAQRLRQMAAYAPQLGLLVLDVYSAFMEDSRGVAALLSDLNPAVHPNNDGYALWAQVVAAEWGLPG